MRSLATRQDIFAWIVHDALVCGIHIDPSSMEYTLTRDNTPTLQMMILNARPSDDFEASMMLSALHVITLDVFVEYSHRRGNMARDIALERLSPWLTVHAHWHPLPLPVSANAIVV